MSSGAGEVVAPRGVFVVGGVGLQAADANEAVRDLPEGGLVAGAAGAELLVVATSAG
jgi:hypothetical protein